MKNEESSVFVRGKIVAICQAILNEEIGVIAGSRIICALEHELFQREVGGWFQNDEDFIAFIAINSETDHLPVDYERKNWSDEGLKRKDEEIAKAEAFHQEDAFEACRKLIERFDMKDISE
ncbi:MAG TPA: hypothetical protein VN256_03590 [Pyrinomonadaceae bacterium]|nr:hypothetical protein [Pyrinomonadaceae bacterium]